MKKLTLLALTLLAYALPCLAAPQTAGEFVVKKVEVEYVDTPEYQVNQPTKAASPTRQHKWVKVEVTFEAVPEFTEELAFNYYVLFAERLFVGRVTHVNILKGHELHSVMFMSPQTIARILTNSANKRQAPVVSGLPITNISVAICKPGVSAPLAVGHYKKGAVGEWWASLKQEEGYLLNKTETPFAPLSWDYYEAIKPASSAR